MHDISQFDYFIAGTWRNRDEVARLTRLLRERVDAVYCFLDAPRSDARLSADVDEAVRRFEAIADWREDSWVRGIFDEDLDGLKGAAQFVLLLPAGASCHIEAGIAYALGKRLTLIGVPEKAQSLYLIFHDVYASIDEFIASIR